MSISHLTRLIIVNIYGWSQINYGLTDFYQFYRKLHTIKILLRGHRDGSQIDRAIAVSAQEQQLKTSRI
ncbi:hypothetical protein D0A34_18330 [Microcoleus vaginatus PCC 9802]|uniref:hypothetical protein n=1 Tax=Microcoleus vaginatus TaxID=119532 RepID=UPI00020D1A8A|nr:hypothetical protein MicvaDRAFT_0404 [Microcoleus vaginatus FGP-2]UNU20579.1 hypothetical protein D0A34_18330 [Microcoleus vaginatus PCC 9802]